MKCVIRPSLKITVVTIKLTRATQHTAEEDSVLRCPDICYKFHLDSE